AVRWAESTGGSGGHWPRSKAIARVLPPWRSVLAADTFVGQGGAGLAPGDAAPIADDVPAGRRGWERPVAEAVSSHLTADPASTHRRAVDVARLAGPGP